MKGSVWMGLVAALVGAPVLAADSGHVGFVEIARVLRESKAAVAARAKLEGTLKQKQVLVDAEKAKVEALRVDLEKPEKGLSQAQKDAKAKELSDRANALQKLVVNSRKEVGEADQASTKVIVDLMRVTLDKLRKVRGYELIVEKGTVLSAGPESDLTDDVIRQMDAQK